ncbi:uncharacterized protein BDR25DRAFT_300758 [Lindgomyces ingoldianus]|uniref:Uncharacterized protein n=1 Tax=Lindgomyces ingoldianus TaxID=673940 RepID=A0ACB6RBS0_9PLEO|nr:uncharacterized protein BDR25DRAFT_300758 [Lindgomyces ingoldianus]KAF2475777.1 hypothetical protein BDR25DRAFT_300758 [Lindgomyces ingoldianus]
MKLLSVLAFTMGVLTAVLGGPSPSPQIMPPPPLIIPSQYYLRANAPNTPFHNRPVVRFPQSHMLGLENFTVHPATTPVYFLPIPIPGKETFAMQVPYSGDDMSETPYVTAIVSKGSHTASMKILSMPDPTATSTKDGCPGVEVTCVADQWSVSGGHPGVAMKGLKYEGWKGGWSVVKDAGTEGWHIYWVAKGEAAKAKRQFGMASVHDVDVDVVPVEAEGEN